MTSFNNVSIKSNVDGTNFSMAVDGTEIKGVKNLKLTMGVEEVTTISLTFIVETVSFDGNVNCVEN